MPGNHLDRILLNQQMQTQSLVEALRVQQEREQLELFKFSEVQRMLKVSRSTLWRMVRRGEMRIVEPVPGIKRVPLTEVQRLVEGRVAQ